MHSLIRLTAVSDFRVRSDMDIVRGHLVSRRTYSSWAPLTPHPMASALRQTLMGFRVILKGRIHIHCMSHRGLPLVTHLNCRDTPPRGRHLTCSPMVPPPTPLLVSPHYPKR